ncbi:hypothetical protein [Brenneria alni]|uniref:hypothetical protein n=1 Tax=Brenneria alni TaxID=71656 RepID=UPI0011C46EAC|nr:hypothetical protein [Brenneria alni]
MNLTPCSPCTPPNPRLWLWWRLGFVLNEDGVVHRPRRFLIYRMKTERFIVGRVLHDAMELEQHMTQEVP